MQFPKSFTLNKKFLLVSILPILFSASTYAMESDYQLFNDEGNKSCCWKRSPAIELDPFDEPNEPKCGLLRSLLCRCIPHSRDPEALLEEDTEAQACCLGLSQERWKKFLGHSGELTSKLLIALGAYRYWGSNELTFFAQHHASDALGEFIKFKKYRFALYPLSLVSVYGIAIGIKYFELDVTGFYTGFNVVASLVLYKIINNFFDQLLRDDTTDREALLERIKALEEGLIKHEITHENLQDALKQLKEHKS